MLHTGEELTAQYKQAYSELSSLLSMAPTNRLLAASFLGILWGRYGPVGLENFFGPYGLTSAAVALLLLIVVIAGFGAVQNWKLKSNVTVTVLSAGLFVFTYLVYLRWVGMRGFAA